MNFDIAALVIRLTLGLFFVLARFRFFFDPSRADHWLNTARYEHLKGKCIECGLRPAHAGFWAYFTATVEVCAGLGLIFGLLTYASALGLIAITIRGTICTARAKVLAQEPVDKLDCVSCYLWRVEGIYIILGLLVWLIGPGAYSLDRLLGIS